MNNSLSHPRVSLEGAWQFRIPGGPVETRIVPGSYECVGDSEYSRSFCIDVPDTGHLHLCFEGITYEASVYLNGSFLGSMLPYSFYSFDIDGIVRNGDNSLLVCIKDLNAPYGPSEGWKSYSGIVRNVYLEFLPDEYLEDVFFHSEFENDYRSAVCNVEFSATCRTTDYQVYSSLIENGRMVAEAKASASEGSLFLTVQDPRLWSPDTPFLYELHTDLIHDGTIIDRDVRFVGLKEFKAVGSRFYLNGRDFFITGVCRHDIWTDEAGFTQTDESIETDLQMIKQMGANYVRLVHYPHDRRVVEAADRIGLLVSEEPGLWWNDLSDREITTRALEVLSKVIYRDRSHVSVAFWLSFNECLFNEEFLHDAVAVSRKADPTRLISGANCNDTYETKRLYDKYDVDFYTMHPYGSRPDHVNGETLEKVCRVLSGKPVIFTEWGGYYVVNNPNLFLDFCNEMRRLHENTEPDPVLAGMSYWQWQDIPEAQRGEPACFDGILTEGLVSIDRKIKNNYNTFKWFLTQLRLPKPEPAYEFIPVGAGSLASTYKTVPLPKADRGIYHDAIDASLPMPGNVHKKSRHITFGPVLSRPVSSLGALPVEMPANIPVTIGTMNRSVTIRVSERASSVWFIGHATLGKGWPYSGEKGHVIGSYTVQYSDGSSLSVELRNGIETASVFCLQGPTLCDPRCTDAVRAFRLSYDKNWEIYQANLFRLQTDPLKEICNITAEITDSEYYLLLYAITLEME